MKSKQLSSEDEKKMLAAADAGPKPPNPLEKTNKLWGGLVNDIKRRYPLFKSDIKDGLNTETLAATVFMYFAALSTAITFGGLASDKTGNLIGISETLIASCLVGMVFHVLAGQPLVIIGTTGNFFLNLTCHKFIQKIPSSIEQILRGIRSVTWGSKSRMTPQIFEKRKFEGLTSHITSYN
jgi:HCO3- transporter family